MVNDLEIYFTIKKDNFYEFLCGICSIQNQWAVFVDIGIIIGTVIGGLVGVFVAVAAVLFYRRRKLNSKAR